MLVYRRKSSTRDRFIYGERYLLPRSLPLRTAARTLSDELCTVHARHGVCVSDAADRISGPEERSAVHLYKTCPVAEIDGKISRVCGGTALEYDTQWSCPGYR